MLKIEKKEWRFVGIIGLILIFLAFFPTLLGFLFTPPGKTFLGRQFVNGIDTPIYYSFIEQVKDGQYLFKNLYTSEAHPAFIFNPFWLLVGFLAKIFSLSTIFTFHLVRFLLVPIFLIVAYYLIVFFFEEKIKRKICFIFLIFASGLGAFWGDVNIEALAKGLVPIDLWVPEAFTFLSIYNSPHFIGSLTLIILIFLLSLFYFENPKMIYSLLAGFSALFLFQFHPYHFPTILGILSVFLVIFSFREKKFNFIYWRHYLILLIFSLPPLFYYFWTLKNVWVQKQHYLQTPTLTPPLPFLLIGYGYFGILALIGFFYLLKKKEKTKKDIFLFSWFVIQALLIYSPLFFQRRLTQGFQIVLAILATFGIFWFKDWLVERKIFQKLFFPQPIFLIYFFLFFFTSSFTILINDLFLYSKGESVMYLPKEKKEAMLWLRKNTPKENTVILSSLENGNLIPAFSLRQVYLGDVRQTAKFQEKLKETNQFFEANNDEERILFLEKNKIDYFFFSQEERKLSQFDPEEKNFLEKVYQNHQTAIYKINTKTLKD